MSDPVIEPTHLAAYIASRICHDLVSPVSSVTSALDFMDEPEGSEMRVQAEDLMKRGAEDASARLEFLRYAFGSVGLYEGTADSHEARRIAERFVATHRPSLDWRIDDVSLNPAHFRLLMNLILLGVDCLPRGGVITAEILPVGETFSFILVARGRRAKIRPDIHQALEGEAPDGAWSARSVQPLFTRIIAADRGGAVSVAETGDEEITLRATGIAGYKV